jgi:hypothetical protein
MNEWSARRKSLYLHRATQHRNTRANIHVLSGIRTHSISVQASGRVHWDRWKDWPLLFFTPVSSTAISLLANWSMQMWRLSYQREEVTTHPHLLRRSIIPDALPSCLLTPPCLDIDKAENKILGRESKPIPVAAHSEAWVLASWILGSWVRILH